MATGNASPRHWNGFGSRYSLLVRKLIWFVTEITVSLMMVKSYRSTHSEKEPNALLRANILLGRENRWMSDVNHRISKTLVEKYGKDTLFVLEDLTGVSFEASNLSKTAKQNYDLRSWAFYQLEQFLTYKAHENRSEVLKVSAKYTSQRCPKCGTIHKENRDHHKHLYRCQCGYESNDDRIGAMNIQLLGTMWISGDNHPRYERITTALE